MQPIPWSSLRRGAIVALGLWIALWAVASLVVVPASAQQPGPTATPDTPIWRGFSALRVMIEDEHRVDLTIIREYSWGQSEFPDGIDSCTEVEERQTGLREFWGWTYHITSLRGVTYHGQVSFNLQAVVLCDEVTQGTPPTATPARTPAASSAALPTPVPGAGARGGFELGGHANELSLYTFSIMRSAGMSWVKQQYRYNLGDSAGVLAGLINAAHSNGFKVLVGIPGRPDQMANFDSYVANYSQFLAGVAALNADAIEVWNEPNIDREWPSGAVNGASYTRLLAGAYNAIKASNPNTLVISGAPAPTGFFGASGCTAQGCNDDVFMQQMAQAGAAQYMDCVGLHYNEGIVAPSATTGDPRNFYPTRYFQLMLSRGYQPFGGRPVCFTELGYLSPEGFGQPLPPAFGWASDTSLAEHAAWLAEAAALAARSGQVRLMIVWNVDFNIYGADPQGGYAIRRPDGTCPACGQLAVVMGR